MRKIFLCLAMSIAASFLLSSCGSPAANNSNNKPSNAATGNSAAPSTTDTAATEAEIKKLITEYAATLTKNDIAAFEKVTADNYMMVGADGSVATKAERVASMKKGDTKFESVVYDEVNVRAKPEGDAAVVIARATAKGVNMGKPIDGASRVTLVWAKRDGGWKIITAHITPIVAAAKPDDKKADTAPAANSNK